MVSALYLSTDSEPRLSLIRTAHITRRQNSVNFDTRRSPNIESPKPQYTRRIHSPNRRINHHERKHRTLGNFIQKQAQRTLGNFIQKQAQQHLGT